MQYTPNLWASDHYGPIFTELVHLNETIKGNFVTVIDDLKKSINLTSLRGGITITDYDGETLTAPGVDPKAPKFADVILTPKKREFKHIFSMDALRASRFNSDMSKGAANMESNEFLRAVLGKVQEDVSKQMEEIFWADVKAAMVATGPNTSVKVATPAVITAANVEDAFQAVYVELAKVPAHKDMVYFADLSLEALINISDKSKDFRDSFERSNGTISYMGIPIKFVPLGLNTIVAGRKTDFYWGTDLLGDGTDNIVVDKVVAYADVMFIRGVFTLSGGVAIQEQKVIYTV